MKGKGRPGNRNGDLTERELEIVDLLYLRNHQIANRLSLSPETIKHHIKYILQKTGAKTRTEAYIMCLKDGRVRLELPFQERLNTAEYKLDEIRKIIDG